jgi:hypothetical protein
VGAQVLKDFMVHQLAVTFHKLRASGDGLNQRELVEDVSVASGV